MYGCQLWRLQSFRRRLSGRSRLQYLPDYRSPSLYPYSVSRVQLIHKPFMFDSWWSHPSEFFYGIFQLPFFVLNQVRNDEETCPVET